MLQHQKINIFQNYIPHIDNSIYRLLIFEGILDGLKFPGTGAGIDVSNAFIDLVKELCCMVDNHGWNGITAQLHDLHFADHIQDFHRLDEYLNLPGASDYSGHIGASTSKLPNGTISQEQFDQLLLHNLSEIRSTIYKLSGKCPKVYGEGIFPMYFDSRTVVPRFINHTLKANGLKNGLDGLVLDICHSSITADYISATSGKAYTFYDYLDDLELSQVAIVHCSGGYGRCCLGTSCNFKDNSDMDPHLVSFITDWEKLLLVLRKAPNVHRVSNEIAYSGKYGGKLSPKDYCSEALLTRVAVASQNIEVIKEASQIISQSLSSDCKNLSEIIARVKSLL